MAEPLFRLEGPKTGTALKSWLVVTVEKTSNHNIGCELWVERQNELGVDPKRTISKLLIWARPAEVEWFITALQQAHEFMKEYNAPPKEKGESQNPEQGERKD